MVSQNFDKAPNYFRVDYVIPDGTMERVVTRPIPRSEYRKGLTVAEKSFREIQEAVGNKYQVIGHSSLPCIAAASLSKKETKDLLESYAEAAVEVRREFLDRIASRKALETE